MGHRTIRSLSELEAIARGRLAAGDDVGEAFAVLAAEGDDIVRVRAARGAGHAPGVAHALNGHPTPARAIELLVASYGACLLDPSTVL